MEVLKTPVDLARRGASQVIASIGGIEINPEQNSWPDALPFLLHVAQNTSYSDASRSTALNALSYLLEALDEYEESPLQQVRSLAIVLFIIIFLQFYDF